MHLIANVTCVSINGLGLLIEGPSGSGKSTLALQLIDRGAVLVGDDGIRVEPREGRLIAHPPPRIGGKIEIRGVGIATLPVTAAPLSLALVLGDAAERLPAVGTREIAGVPLPTLLFAQGGEALRAEWALRLHGLPLPDEFA